MKSASPIAGFTGHSLRALSLIVLMMFAACAHHVPPPAAAPRPARPAKPVVTEAQNRERARQALQKATVSSNEYSACMMFATSAHRGSGASPDEIANAAAASCATKLDDYEQSMTTYHEFNPVKIVSTANPRARAREDRLSLDQKTREAVIQSLDRGE